jgi:hypothetical protein
MKKYLRIFLMVILIGAAVYYHVQISSPRGTLPPPSGSPEGREIADAFRNRQSDVWVTGSGIVLRVLDDDTRGSRHQRFILQLGGDQTVLITHNTDLAPRIPRLMKGDTVRFRGEYVWNSRGGVVHWTHHDPGGHHKDGWLEHNGRVYK